VVLVLGAMTVGVRHRSEARAIGIAEDVGLEAGRMVVRVRAGHVGAGVRVGRDLAGRVRDRLTRPSASRTTDVPCVPGPVVYGSLTNVTRPQRSRNCCVWSGTELEAPVSRPNASIMWSTMEAPRVTRTEVPWRSSGVNVIWLVAG